MKLTKEFKLANVVLASALALAGCGDDPLSMSTPGNTVTPQVALSGNVADGYLTGATVCLDLNSNKVCDVGEPEAITSSGGAFTFDATQSQIDSTPLLVEVTDTTIDEDFPTKILTPYTLSAPAGYTFVSPLTSMVQNEIEQNGSTLAIAEKAIQDLLGTTLSLDSDYIAGADDDTASDESKAAFAKLHKVAQVVAGIVAEEMSASENESYSTNALSSAIMMGVIAKLETITQQVDAAIQVENEGGEAFDSESIASGINIDVSVEAVETTISEYILISSIGSESEITEDMVIGEWSTGSVINSGTYEGLSAWTVTSAGSWGTVLAFSDGFSGDFSKYNKLKLKIATSGGYSGALGDGYYIKMSAGGVETADIALDVDDSVTGWQDVELDLDALGLDLSSVEYITVFAKTGTAGESKIYIADLSLAEVESEETTTGDTGGDTGSDTGSETNTENYVLISSTGSASEINENTVVGEWSTGSVIDSASEYDGLSAWSVTSAGSWGTVLAFTGGFEGDFSGYDQLELKIATSGGYSDGYFIKISTNGEESGDIALAVSDSTTGWQDVVVDLSNYDLSSIEYITVFAKTGTADSSKIYLADLFLSKADESTDTTAETYSQEYVLIASDGTDSEITENTVIGEWSTGSIIDSTSEFDGLPAWSVTSAGSWGTVLAFSEGFAGDFSDFDKLKIKIATSGGYSDGYFVKVSTNGTESADIPLSVSDSNTGWQDVEVDLSNYDLSSIEFITVFAKTGTAGISKFYIADLALVQLNASVTDPEKVALDNKISEAAVFVETSYTATTWASLTTALALPETTEAEMIAKTEAITTAIAGLEQTDSVDPVDPVEPGLEVGPNLVVNGDFDSSALADNAGSVGEWNYYTNTGTVVAIADSQLTAVVTSVGGGQWDNQIWNQVHVTEEGDYVVKLTASSTVERDILIRVDAIGMNGNGTTSTASDVIAHLTPTPQEFTLTVSGSAFTADAAFKIVTSLGVLEAANTTSVASTVTFDDVFLGILAEAVAADTTELETAIASAQVRHDGGADETLKATYQAAIDAAQAVVDDVDVTQTEADAALATLAIASASFDPTIIAVEGNLVINGNFADEIVVDNAGTVGEWNYYSSTGTVVAIADQVLTAEVTTVGGQWDNQIWNEVQVIEAGNYVLRFTASSTVERDILIRVDGIEMFNDGSLSAGSDIIAHLTSTPQTFTRYFSGSQFAGNPRFKVVTSVGGLEAAGTTSVASTVTYHDVYLGIHAGDIPTDIATLSSAITVATNVVNTAVEGTETGQYTTSKADLQAAIVAAQTVVDNAETTQEEADVAVIALATASATFEAGLVVEAIAGAQISTPAGVLNFTPDSWGTGTVQDLEYTGDATYSQSIQLEGTGSWGTVLAMTGIPTGTLAQYTSIDFKIKTTDFTEIKVKVPEVEMGYALTSGTDLGDGWVQMSIPMSDFGDTAPATAEQFAIFGLGGTGTILLSEIGFTNN